jgi:hypothetical protein
MEWSEKISSLLNYPINRIEIKVIDNDKRKINLY